MSEATSRANQKIVVITTLDHIVSATYDLPNEPIETQMVEIAFAFDFHNKATVVRVMASEGMLKQAVCPKAILAISVLRRLAVMNP